MPELADNSLDVELVARGFKDPTSMAFLGPNDILVTEKSTGIVQRIVNGESLDEPLLDVNVNSEDERGLLGMVTSKNLSNDKTYVFLYFTEAESHGANGPTKDNRNNDGGEPIGNRLYRYELSEDGTKLINPKLLLDLPYKPGPAHNGGALTLGPDNNIYLTIGELTPTSYGKGDFKFKVQNYADGREPDGRAGILRVTQNGSVAGGKGILGNEYPLNLYYAYGMRNSFGIGFDPLTGYLWDTENGPSYGDEINLVEPGFNSGWAKILGFWKVVEVIDKDDNREIKMGEAISKDTIGNLVSFGGRGKYSDPELAWNRTIAPTSVAFLNSNNLGKNYLNDLFVGTAKNKLLHFDLNNNRSELILNGSVADRVVDEGSDIKDYTFGDNFGIITDIEVGPDGYLYILTGVRDVEGKIYRIVPNSTVA